MSKRVMVVDDDQDLREAVAAVLESEGYEVVQAGGGVQALERLRSPEPRPDLIILDLMMPDMNGWQFRDAQRIDPDLADIPVLVLTASRSLHLNPIAAEQVMLKPLELDQLIGTVAASLRG
jgi:CheY-like chemotaxis protein